jgi:hypothetical protein
VSSNGEAALAARLRADLYALVAVDVTVMPDATLRSELVELLAAANQLNAAIASRIASFDTRNLADDDGCQTTKVWLRCYGRSSDTTASRLVHQARLLGDLPAVAEAAGRGDVTADHVGQIEKLARKVGVEQVQRGAPWIRAPAGRPRSVRRPAGPARAGWPGSATSGTRSRHRLPSKLTIVDGVSCDESTRRMPSKPAACRW